MPLEGPPTTRPPRDRASAAADTHTVTLITGDKVTVQDPADGRSAATVQRPANLTGGVRTQTVGKDLYVYPAEALPYLAAGVLDQRLFDVSRLIADGYDDAHAAGLPLIVQYGGDGAAPNGRPPAGPGHPARPRRDPRRGRHRHPRPRRPGCGRTSPRAAR